MAPLEGPVGVGALIDAVMLGCLIVQSFVYYKNSRARAWSLSVLVSLILAFSLMQLGCMVAWLWANGRADAKSEPAADYAAIHFGISNAFGAVILFSERCFFTNRILKLANNHLLAFMFFIICIFSFTAALGAACIFFTEATADLTRQLGGGWIFPLVIISGLVCDLAISITTTFYTRSQTPTEIADVLGRVTRLFLLVAETGIVTSFFDVALVLVYWTTKSNFAWVALLLCMPGVFANTLLTAINAHGKLGADVEHQRASTLGDKLIDEQAKRPPIKITIYKQIEKRSEKSPV